jgi:hypothetical protein
MNLGPHTNDFFRPLGAHSGKRNSLMHCIGLPFRPLAESYVRRGCTR